MLIDYTWIERDGRTPACFRKDIRGTSALTTFKYFYQHLTSLRIFVVKKHLPMWSPCIYRGGRKKEHALYVSHLVYDVDDGTPLEALYSFGAYRYIAHTSWSHTPELPKWRLILPLKKRIPAQEWRYAWQTGSQLWKDLVGTDVDPTCKNANRFYFVLGAPKERRLMAQSAINEEGELLSLEYKIPPKKEIITYNYEERSRQDRYTLSRADRISLAQSLGGEITPDRAVKIPCPKCGRSSLWFWLDPTTMKTARCNHQNSCGFFCYPSQLK